jgi:hypothetical protein
MSNIDVCITSQNSNNDEDEHILIKYADELDNISNDFIERLPPNDKAALTKLLEQQQKILPLEEPFTLVQPKMKGKIIALKDKDVTTPPVSPKTTQKLSPNRIFSFEKNLQESTTPVKNNAKVTYNQTTRNFRDSIPSGRGQMQYIKRNTGRGGGVITKTKSTYTTLPLPDLKPLSPSTIFKIQDSKDTIPHPYDINTNENQVSISSLQQAYHQIDSIPFKTNNEEQYTFCIHISVRKRKPTDEMTKEATVEHILQSLIAGNQKTKLLSTPTPTYQNTLTKSLYQPESTQLINNSRRYLNCLEISKKGNIHGNIWINSSIPYTSIKRSLEYKRKLTSKYNTYIVVNNLNTKTPTEIGYFIHRLVRHDTVENTNYTRSFLPRNHKPF